MLLLTLFLSFTGYLLPWDQLAYWAVTVGTNIAASIPWAGPRIRELLIGGRGIDQATLIRFYVLHVIFLPGVLGGLFAYHMWRIRKDGGLARVDRVATLREKAIEEPVKTKTYTLLGVARGGGRVDVRVTPMLRGKKGWVGVGLLDESKTVHLGPVQAMTASLQRNYEFGGLIFQTLVGLATRETSPKQLMGPVGIAQLSGESAARGWLDLFGLMAMISLNLGIINLLPIPVLDGGHIFIMALEGLARRDFSARLKEKMLLAGFAVLMLLMVTVIYNDLMRVQWIERLAFWK